MGLTRAWAGWEPEVVDWDAEGMCEDVVIAYGRREGEVRCGRPFGERPDSDCYRKDQHRCNARHGGAVVPCDLRKRDCQRLTQEARETRLGVRPDPLRLTAIDVYKAIRERHSSPLNTVPEWLVLEEVGLGMGGDRERRVDALAFRLWQTRGTEIHAYEVKVTRSDLLGELAEPSKRRPAMECSTHFWFITPVGLMTEAEVPDGCGLIEVGKRPRGSRSKRKYQTNPVVEAPKRRIESVTPRLVHCMAWRLRNLQRSIEARGIVL